jgi:hypothetical protein
MAIVKIKVTELFDGDVRWISLVKRGANRLPIKILKSEEEKEMGGINLGAMLFRKRDGQRATPATDEMTIAAVVIRKDEEYTDKLVAKVKDLGLKVEDKEEDDSVIILKQDAWQDDESQMVSMRLNDDVGIILGGNARKFFDPFSDSMDFDENVSTKGFFPGLAMSMEALMSTVSGIMRNSEKRQDAGGLIESALDAHKSFVMSLTKKLPMVAFKLEDLDGFELLNKGDCAECGKAKAEHETSHDRAAGEGTDFQGCPPGTQRDDKGNCIESAAEEQGHGVIEAGAGSENTTGDDGAAIGATKSPGNPDENNANLSPRGDCPAGSHLVDGRCVPMETGATSEAPPPVGTGAGQLGAETGEMLKALNKITETMQAVTTAVSGLSKDVGKQQDRLNSVEDTAKAAAKAVEGTALVGSTVQPEDLDGMRADRSRSKDDTRVQKGFWGNTQMEKMFSPEFTADLKE